MAGFRNRRFCVALLWVRMWRRPARRRRTFPVPVTLKRLAVPRFVLIFGMGLVLLLGDEHHRHTTPFEPGLLLDDGDVGHLVRDLPQHRMAELGMGDRPPAEEHAHLHALA